MKIYSLFGLIIMCLAFGWYQSNAATSLAKAEAKKEKALAESVSKQLADAKTEKERVDILLTNYQTTKQEIKYVDRVVTKTVIEYRDIAVDRCPIDGLWVYTYNLSTLPKADSSPRVDDPTIRLRENYDPATVLEVATHNNRQCIYEKERLRALQGWVLGL